MKLNISLDDELVKRADEYADLHYMSRSGLISYVLALFLNKNDADMQVKEIDELFNVIAENSDVMNDSDIYEKLSFLKVYANGLNEKNRL